MDVIPDRSESTSGMYQPTALAKFRWETCPRHAWLRRSVVITRDAPPMCIPEGGHYHYLDPDELEAA